MLLAAIFSCGQAYAAMRVEAPDAGNGTSANQEEVQKSGKLDAVYASASKLVIDGVTYAYNPLTTIVTVNGRRSTISELLRGETVQFQTVQGPHKAALLTSVSVQRR